MIDAKTVQELKTLTGVPLMRCKEALEASDGNIEAAHKWLREHNAAIIYETGTGTEGQVFSYIHTGGKLGVLVEIACETDFTAKTEEFQKFGHDLAMHIAAANPAYLSRANVPGHVTATEMEICLQQLRATGKNPPQNMLDKILEGKLEKYFSEVCLLDQEWVQNPKIRIRDIVSDLRATLKENIEIRSFTRVLVGESFRTNRKDGGNHE